jgi:hypothetical protein
MGQCRLTIRLAAVAAVSALIAGCATSQSTAGPLTSASVDSSLSNASPTAGRTAHSAEPASPAPTDSAVSAAPPRLIVVGDGVKGGFGIWGFDASGRWASLALTPTATGLARVGDNLAVLSGGSVELRTVATVAATGTEMPLKWTGSTPSRIVSLSRSPNGRVALVSTNGDEQSYWLAAADGTTALLQPAPAQPFAPIVGWLDDTRLLVLSTDNLQRSRLTVIDLTARTSEQSSAVSGIRFFGISPNREYVAVATDSTMYSGPVEAFLEALPPPAVATIDPSTPTVVWALAPDDTGARLAILSATLSSDGRATNTREIVYGNGSGSWTKTFDSPAPFTQALGQVWLP